MATRKDLFQTDVTRAKIQASQLLNRLNDHIFKGVKMEATQLKAAEILLRKSLPDLSSVDMTSGGKELQPISVVQFGSDPNVLEQFYRDKK